MLSPTPLPVSYSALTREERPLVRARYTRLQDGLCWHCENPLDLPPPYHAQHDLIDWRRFPIGFQNYPVHLHHDHSTDLTIGSVHALCNAVLWQFHGQ